MIDHPPTSTVYIVASDYSVNHLMVFNTEEAAIEYAERTGNEVLPSEPVFDSAQHCIDWCGIDLDEEDV